MESKDLCRSPWPPETFAPQTSVQAVMRDDAAALRNLIRPAATAGSRFWVFGASSLGLCGGSHAGGYWIDTAGGRVVVAAVVNSTQAGFRSRKTAAKMPAPFSILFCFFYAPFFSYLFQKLSCFSCFSYFECCVVNP